MATRILICTGNGQAFAAIDGHGGAKQAAEWVRQVSAQLIAQGDDPIVMELTPEQGGEAVRADLMDQLHLVRCELRTQPGGAREIIGLHRTQSPRAGDAGLKRAAIALPERVPCSLRVLRAPEGIANARHAMRMPRTRLDPPA